MSMWRPTFVTVFYRNNDRQAGVIKEHTRSVRTAPGPGSNTYSNYSTIRNAIHWPAAIARIHCHIGQITVSDVRYGVTRGSAERLSLLNIGPKSRCDSAGSGHQSRFCKWVA